MNTDENLKTHDQTTKIQIEDQSTGVSSTVQVTYTDIDMVDQLADEDLHQNGKKQIPLDNIKKK